MRTSPLPSVASLIHSRVVLAVSLAVLVMSAGALKLAPTAVAGPSALTGAALPQASIAVPPTPLAARGGGGFRASPRINRNRPVTRNRNSGRALRNFGQTMLRALGIAFLLSLLFGIGTGGSPLGLLLLLGIIALVVSSRRRRRQLHHR